MGPTKFQSKPSTVEAVRWDGTPKQAEDIIAWVKKGGASAVHAQRTPMRRHATITILGVPAVSGDWIGRRESGEFFIVSDAEFDATYEKAGRA